MDLVSMYQGYVKCVFGSENSSSSLDSCIKCLLDRISYGVLAEDRGNAMLNFNLLYQKVMLHNWLLEQRVQGALETLIHALTPIHCKKGPNNGVQPALMNNDLLSREVESISLLISLLSDEDFRV